MKKCFYFLIVFAHVLSMPVVHAMQFFEKIGQRVHDGVHRLLQPPPLGMMMLCVRVHRFVE